MSIKLVQDYVTLDGDIMFDINNGNKQVGEMTISNDFDCYVVMLKAYTDFHIDYKNKIDSTLEELFGQIFEYINESSLIDQFNKPVLLLDDEVLGSRYAITHELRRVPRYCGYYLY